jgi:EAL domain-containing protein (putative c-di-GMP-specific phosphodiesterase class I)
MAPNREEIVRAADLALYAAKHGGRGQFRFYSSDLKDEKEERRLLEEALRDAVASVDGSDDSWDEPQLSLVYQPVVRTDDHAVVGFEALMRWEHPQRGTVPPTVFIPVAEDTGMILQLGAWALRQAARDAALWPHPLRIAVNVSAVQFAHPDFPGIVREVLDARPAWNPSGSNSNSPNPCSWAIARRPMPPSRRSSCSASVCAQCVRTGYSSLSYLRAAPFDKLKVDRSFVESCTLSDRNSAKIIAAIIGLADALGMETTVEGVEAFDQRDVVCAKGARFIQGFLYSPRSNRRSCCNAWRRANCTFRPMAPSATARSAARSIAASA